MPDTELAKPDERAFKMARDALLQLNNLRTLADFVGDDASEQQVLHLANVLRNYRAAALSAARVEAMEDVTEFFRHAQRRKWTCEEIMAAIRALAAGQGGEK